MRKSVQARNEMVKDVNGEILGDGIEVRRRWAEYFEQVLNVEEYGIRRTLTGCQCWENRMKEQY